VVLKGKIGGIEIVSAMNPRYKLADARYYQDVDWALDISQASFSSTHSVGGVPAHLILRDKETQVVVKRENVIDERFRQIPLEGIISIIFSGFLRSEEPEMLLIAPKRHRDFKSYLEDCEVLRKEGIVECD